jgi:GT2 family glycosyltransferase
MSGLPSVALIVVNWNGRAYLERCLSSLLGLDYPDFSVTVVDSASSDGSQRFIRERFSQVELRCSSDNLGYGGSANTILRECSADIAVILNADLTVPPSWLTSLIAPMIEDCMIGIAGCKMYYPGGRTIQHAGGYVTRPQAWAGHYGLNEQDQGQFEVSRDVDYVIGAALAVKQRALQQIGLFDEGYFLYYEDVDLCQRARQAGYRVVYIPGAWLTHYESATTIKGSAAYLQQFFRGRWRFILKHYDPSEILSDSMPAERMWLKQCGPVQREAAAVAYRATLSALPQIWLARSRDGAHGKPIVEEEQALISEQLQDLIEVACHISEPPPLQEVPQNMNNEPTYPASTLQQLRMNQQVQEQPFRSRVPLLGPVIAWFRKRWNDVSTTWYVRPLIAQQNRFNAAVVDQLTDQNAVSDRREAQMEELGMRLRDHEAWLIERDKEQAGYVRDLAELTVQIVQLNHQLQELRQLVAPGKPPPGMDQASTAEHSEK